MDTSYNGAADFRCNFLHATLDIVKTNFLSLTKKGFNSNRTFHNQFPHFKKYELF